MTDFFEYDNGVLEITDCSVLLLREFKDLKDREEEINIVGRLGRMVSLNIHASPEPQNVWKDSLCKCGQLRGGCIR